MTLAITVLWSNDNFIEHYFYVIPMELLCFEQLPFGSFITTVKLEKSLEEKVVIIVGCQRLFGEVKCFFTADSIVAPSFSSSDDEMLIELVTNHPLVWLMSHEYHKYQRVKDENILEKC